MEFIGMTRYRGNASPERQREVLRVFSQWQPPEGFNLKWLYFSADRTRSFGLVEVDDAGLLLQVAATFGDYVDFEWVPILPAQEGAAITAQANTWVDQVKGG
jgi:hypothetical protein